LRTLRVIGFAALVLAGLAPAAAWTLDRVYGQTVQPVTRNAPEVVKLNKMLYEPGPESSVAEIYGVPTNQKMRVLFVNDDKIVRPKEDPSLTLLLLDKQKGDNPLQAKTVWFIAWRVLAGFLFLAALALLASLILSLRRRRSATPPRGPSSPYPPTGAFLSPE
jgi:hypothetical protein